MAIATYLTHFATLDTSIFDVREAGATIVATDSYADFDVDEDRAAMLVSKDVLDLSQNHHFTFWVRRVSGATVDLIQLVDSVSAPVTGTSSLANSRIFSVALASGALQIKYDPDGDGSSRYWDEANEVWTAKGVSANAVDIRDGADADWYVVHVHIDGGTGQIMARVEHQNRAALSSHDQGLREVARCEWVAIDVDFATRPQNLWMCVGHRYSDVGASHNQVEYARLDIGTKKTAWSNDRTPGSRYIHSVNRSYGGPRYFRVSRTSTIGIPAEGYEDLTSSGGRRKKHGLEVGGTIYYWRESFTASGSSIGLSTATDVDGPWTNEAGNPVMDLSTLIGAGYVVHTAPWVVYDDREPADSKYRMVFGAELNDGIPTHRMFLAKAPAPEGPWTLVSHPTNTDGAILLEFGTNKYAANGVNDPVIYWRPGTNDWGMYFSGYRQKPAGFPWTWAGTAPWANKAGWAIFHATSSDLVSWTVSNSGDPVLHAQDNQLRGFSGITNNTITGMSDTGGFVKDLPMWVFGSTGSDNNWLLTRVRKQVSGTSIELLHRSGGISSGGPGIIGIQGGSLTPHALVDEGTQFRLYATAFQPGVNTTLSGLGNCEIIISFTSSSPDGPWTIDLDNSPAAPLTHPDWGGSHSVENFAFPNEPIAFAQTAQPDAPDATTIGDPSVNLAPLVAGADAPSSTTVGNPSASLGTLVVGADAPGQTVVGDPSTNLGAITPQPDAPAATIVNDPSTNVGMLVVQPDAPTETTIGDPTANLGVIVVEPDAPDGTLVGNPASTPGLLVAVPDAPSQTTVGNPSVSAEGLFSPDAPSSTVVGDPTATLGTLTAAPDTPNETVVGDPSVVPDGLTPVQPDAPASTTVSNPSATLGLLVVAPDAPSATVVGDPTVPFTTEPEERAIADVHRYGFAASLSLEGEPITYRRGGSPSSIVAIIRRNSVTSDGPHDFDADVDLWIARSAVSGILDPARGDEAEIPKFYGSTELITVRVDVVHKDSDEARWHLGAVV